MSESSINKDSYAVGWLCALDIELAASRAMLDEIHPDLIHDETDSNNYTLGRIGQHNVVLACLPSGTTGTNPAATAVANMLRSFPRLRFGLMVGVGGGAPDEPSEDPYEDIRLGDVVVSDPGGAHSGVIQYDFGKTMDKGEFFQTGSLNKPPAVLRAAVSSLKARHLNYGIGTYKYVADMLESKPNMKRKFRHPGSENDQLFAADYDHYGDSKTCEKCDKTRLLSREPRDTDEPVIHYGLIGSANQVMRHGATRERFRKEKGIMCFEMEAAGLMDNFPCLVIRGVCDYSDTHKNKRWQPYAAVTAAAYAKELLGIIPAAQVASTLEAAKVLEAVRNGFDTVHVKLDSLRGDMVKAQDDECLRDLLVTNPQHDMKRIEESKDLLLEDSYAWVLKDPVFISWRDNDDNRLLWIKGDPGKGKTMMMIGLVKELSLFLSSRESDSEVLSFFFCQGTDTRLNNAVSILRGLIYLMAVNRPRLIPHLRTEYDKMGKQLFEGSNAFYALRGVIANMLSDSSLTKIYLIVDALDECDSSLVKLLEMIAPRDSEAESKVKWLVTSRYNVEIEERLQPDRINRKISLELNSSNVTLAVNAFIDHKVSKLARGKKDAYDDKAQKTIRDYLYQNAEGTFLWVALVIKRLEEIPLWKIKAHLPKVLETFPPKLDNLYERMMDQIQMGDAEDVKLYNQILHSVTLAYRPLHLEELVATASLPEELCHDAVSIGDLVRRCGSFLTIRKDVVYLVHQSAKDYFSNGNGLKIFPMGKEGAHSSIVRQSLKIMSMSLRKNICDIDRPDTHPEDVPDKLKNERFIHIRYSCCHWVDHLQMSQVHLLEIEREIYKFFKEHFLHWIEALAFMGEMATGVSILVDLMNTLTDLPPLETPLLKLVHDANRFLMKNTWIIQEAPAQIYCSALLFAPTNSLIRAHFASQIPNWFEELPNVDRSWGYALQSLESDSNEIRYVAASSDGRKLATAVGFDLMRIWDAQTGKCEKAFTKSSEFYCVAVAFFENGKKLAAKSSLYTIQIWNTDNWEIEHVLYGDDGAGCIDNDFNKAGLEKMTTSADSSMLASPSDRATIKIWDTRSWKIKVTLSSGRSRCLGFSPDSRKFASASRDDKSITVWDTHTWSVERQWTDFSFLWDLSFSPDNKRLAMVSKGLGASASIQIWDLETGALEKTIHAHRLMANCVTFSPDGSELVSGSCDRSIRVWDSETGQKKHVLEGHLDQVKDVIFIGRETKLASVSNDGTLRLWDLGAEEANETPKAKYPYKHCKTIDCASNGRWVAAKSVDGLRVWNTHTRTVEWAHKPESAVKNSSAAFSPDSTMLAVGLTRRYGNSLVEVWSLDGDTFELKHRHTGDIIRTPSPIFSPDSKKVASVSNDSAIKIWDTETGKLDLSLDDHPWLKIHSLVFSTDGSKIAGARTILNADLDIDIPDYHSTDVLDARTGEVIRSLKWPDYDNVDADVSGPETIARLSDLDKSREIAFSPNSNKLAVACRDCNIQIRDTEEWGLEQTLKGHSLPIHSVAFSPDGKKLASTSIDSVLNIWAVDTGKLEQTLEAYPALSSNSVFSSSGSTIASPFYSLDKSGRWITHNGTNIIYLPADYRTGRVTGRGDILAIGISNIRCVFFHFRPRLEPII